ncbi:hypothetical protein FNV62_54680 [Streptomyces sp. RLB3-17]|uniref:Uncharacterized protein n=2 Tax=Streptomyces mirabilis TaxID=68239 RepID=A0ABU3V6Z8_9ACTN|nr:MULTISPECIES: hypothetical protein [Streptomyces]MDU9001928.1 hypothetical protein [Streptomyces mirabilis]QDO45791.1 hypothetical protein FNV62_54680 [Streptomyces sp. RLB3-17]
MKLARRSAIASLNALLACTLAGCGGGSHRSSTAPHIPAMGITSAPATVPGSVGYLYTDGGEVDYLQWQSDASGTFQGTGLDATVKGSVPDEQVSIGRSNFDGQLSTSTVTLSYMGNTARGVLSDDTLTINVVTGDGSIRPFTYHRASDGEYNVALAKLKQAVSQANAQENLSESQAGAVQKVSKDYEAINTDESSLRSDLTGLGDDVTSTEADLASEHADEQNVLTEAGDGTDNSSVCGDASGVSGDASGVSGDASSFSGDLQVMTTDLSTLHNDASTLTSDLQALLKIEPGYAGDGNNPSPSDVQRAVSVAASAADGYVKQANHKIGQENGDVATAYGYAADASKAGNCNLAADGPTPIGRISSPFVGQSGAST